MTTPTVSVSPDDVHDHEGIDPGCVACRRAIRHQRYSRDEAAQRLPPLVSGVRDPIRAMNP